MTTQIAHGMTEMVRLMALSTCGGLLRVGHVVQRREERTAGRRAVAERGDEGNRNDERQHRCDVGEHHAQTTGLCVVGCVRGNTGLHRAIGHVRAGGCDREQRD